MIKNYDENIMMKKSDFWKNICGKIMWKLWDDYLWWIDGWIYDGLVGGWDIIKWGVSLSSSHTQHRTPNSTHSTSHTWVYLGSILFSCYMIQTCENYTCGVVRSFNFRWYKADMIRSKPRAFLGFRKGWLTAKRFFSCSLSLCERYLVSIGLLYCPVYCRS